MRPKTIVYFEWIIFGTLLLRVLQSFLVRDRYPLSVLLIGLIFGIVVSVALTLLVSRRRSKTAMWVSIALFVFGVPLVVQQIMTGPRVGSEIIWVVQIIGQGVAYALLFTPSARHWMRRADEKLREVFD